MLLLFGQSFVCCLFVVVCLLSVFPCPLLQLLFDGRLSEAVLFSYNAKAVDGQLCLESSPLDNPSPFVHSPHATILEVSVWCAFFLPFLSSLPLSFPPSSFLPPSLLPSLTLSFLPPSPIPSLTLSFLSSLLAPSP